MELKSGLNLNPGAAIYLSDQTSVSLSNEVIVRSRLEDVGEIKPSTNVNSAIHIPVHLETYLYQQKSAQGHRARPPQLPQQGLLEGYGMLYRLGAFLFHF